MIPVTVDNSLVIAASMALLPSGHPDALREVQRQMRLINKAYPDPAVLRLTDECVRHVAVLHGPPGGDDEETRRSRARAAIGRLRAHLEGLPEIEPRRLNRRPRARTR